MQTTTTSKFMQLNLRDAAEGLIFAAIVAFLETLYESLLQGVELSDIDWNEIVKHSITVAIGYLLRQVFTSAKVVVNAPDSTVKEVEEGKYKVSITEKR